MAELKLLRVGDLVKMFHISKATPKKWEEAGILRGIKIGKCTFYRESEILKLIEEGERNEEKPSGDQIDNPDQKSGAR